MFKVNLKHRNLKTNILGFLGHNIYANDFDLKMTNSRLDLDHDE